MSDHGNPREELVRLIHLVVVEGTKISGTFAALHGLHHTDGEALARVLVAQERGAPMSAGELATELGLTSGAITFVVDRLERAGHISRVRDDTDRRKVFLHYSPGGRALAEEFFGPVQKRSDDVMDQFTPEELEVVRRFLADTGAAMVAHRQSLTSQATGGSGIGSHPDRAAGA